MTPHGKARTAEQVADACARLCEVNAGKGACEKCIAQAIRDAQEEAADAISCDHGNDGLRACACRYWQDKIRALKPLPERAGEEKSNG